MNSAMHVAVNMADLRQISCPTPITNSDRIMLGHGSGGRLSADLIRRLFLPAFANDVLNALEDQATLTLPSPRFGGEGLGLLSPGAP